MHWTAPSEKDSHTDTLENRITTFAAAALGRIAMLEAQIHCFRRTRDPLLRDCRVCCRGRSGSTIQLAFGNLALQSN